MFMIKISFYSLIIVLAITFAGFYFLYSQKNQLAADVDLLKDKIDIIKEENRNLNIRIRALEDTSLKSITQKATKSLQKTVDAMLNVIDQKVEEARRLNSDPKPYSGEPSNTPPATDAPSPAE